jgi:hypothetical protein
LNFLKKKNPIFRTDTSLEEKIGALKAPFLRAAEQAKERNHAVNTNGRKIIDSLQKRVDILLRKEQDAIHKEHNAIGDYMQVSTEFARLARKKIEPVVAFQQNFILKPNVFFEYIKSLEELESFALQCVDYENPKGKSWMHTGCVSSKSELESSKQIADSNMQFKIRILMLSKKCKSANGKSVRKMINAIDAKLKTLQPLKNIAAFGEQLLAFGCRGDEK